MRVPITRTPRTNVVPIQEGYARAASVDFSAIGDTLRQVSKELELEQKGMQEFDLRKRIMQETNELQKDFETRKQAAPLGASGFVDQLLTDQEARHTALLEEYRGKGYDEEILQNAELRLGALRQNFGERGLVFQSESVRGLASSELGKFKVNVSQYVTTNPEGFASGEQEMRDAWMRFPGLTAVERDKGFTQDQAELRAAAAKGLALKNPTYVIEKLDPYGYTAPAAVAPAASGQGAYGILEGWQAVPTTVAAELGLDPEEVAAVMSFETGGTLDPNIMGGDGGKYRGLIQFGPEEQRTYGIGPSSTPEDWTKAVLGFMKDRGFKPGMGIEDFYSTILTGGPGRYDAKDSNGTSVRNAIPKIMAEHRDNARRWLGEAVKTFDPGASTATQAPPVETPEPPTSPTFEKVETGDYLLDSMSGAERLQALGWAREQQARKNVSNKAAYDVAQNNIDAALETGGEYAGPVVPEEQFIAEFGPVVGTQKFAEQDAKLAAIAEMQKIKTQSPTQIDAAIAKMKPDPNAEDYGPRQRIYAAMQTARDKNLAMRKEDPAAYVFQAFPEVARSLESANTSDERKAAYAEILRAHEQIGTPERQRSLLTKQQLEALGESYKRAGPSDRLNILESTISEMGPGPAGQTLGKAVGKAVAEDLAIYAMIRRNGNYRSVFTQIQEGRLAIEKDPARRLPPSAVNGAYLAGTSGAINSLSGDMSRVINQAAEALYVQKGGRVGPDGQLDPALYRLSLREALGGNKNSNTGIVDLTGGTRVRDWTILPAGVNGIQFENFVDSMTNTDIARLTGGKQPRDNRGEVLPLYRLRDEGVFVMLAPGIYGVKLNTHTWVGDGTGNRLKFRLSAKDIR